MNLHESITLDRVIDLINRRNTTLENPAMTENICCLVHYTGRRYLTNIKTEIRYLTRTGYWRVLSPSHYAQIK